MGIGSRLAKHQALRLPPTFDDAARTGAQWKDVARHNEVFGPLSGSAATRMVLARSEAQMPVVIPSAASMEAVKAVSIRGALCFCISGILRWSIISGLIGRQIRRLPCVAMRMIAFGVTSSASVNKK